MQNNQELEESEIDVTFENDSVGEDIEDLYPIENFKLTTTPNDFNISTIISFLDAGVFKIPDFQRNYVWDIAKASKLIESLLIGLPIPQMFLYEKARNEFYVIDGQQRLMSLYFFVKGRFPKNAARLKLRDSYEAGHFISEKFLADDESFSSFSLKLDSRTNPKQNKFHGLNYKTLDQDDRVTLDLATIRNMVIKPSEENDSNAQAMFEIFNRLNSGGMNLNSQEIRMSLFNSLFLQKLVDLNKNDTWRRLLNKEEPDLRLKDVETILRLFGMLLAGNDSVLKNKKFSVEYQNSILGFLNNVADYSKVFDEVYINLLSAIWDKFMEECEDFRGVDFTFSSDDNSKMSITFFEAVFYASCRKALENKNTDSIDLTQSYLDQLKSNSRFRDAAIGKTTSKSNVQDRLKIALSLYEV